MAESNQRPVETLLNECPDGRESREGQTPRTRAEAYVDHLAERLYPEGIDPDLRSRWIDDFESRIAANWGHRAVSRDGKH